MSRPTTPKTERLDKRVQTYLSGPEFKKLEKRAKAEGRSKAQYVRGLVQADVAKNSK